MKNILLALGILLVFLSCEPNKIGYNSNEKLSESEHLVMATAWFQKSAEMRACFYQAYNLAEFRLKQHFENYKGDKPCAVILDIDETVLDNSPFEKYLIDNNLRYTNELWKQWTDMASAKALPGALEFTQLASELGIQVIYLSNRKVAMLESTIKNLNELGFPNADPHFVYLRELEKSNNKTERRQMVMDKYEVLLLIGDNLTDLNELFAQRDSTLGLTLVDSYRRGFGDRFIILPNPMYGEWEKAIYKNDYDITPEKMRALRKEILEGY